MIKTKQSISFSAETSCFLYNIIHRLGCVIRGCGNEFCEIKDTCVMNLNEPMNVTQYCCICGLINGTLTTGVLNSLCVGLLAFDFCRFCVVIRVFHPRHNGQ